MNIEKTEIKNSSINQITKTTITTENSTKFSDELKDLKNNNTENNIKTESEVKEELNSNTSDDITNDSAEHVFISNKKIENNIMQNQIKQPIISDKKIENKVFENQNQTKQPTVLDEKIENKVFENQNQIKQPIISEEKIENKMFENQNQIKQPIISEEKIENKMFENQNQIKQPTVLDEKIENKMFENQNQIKQPIVPDEKIENKMFENQNQIKQPIISEEKIENKMFENQNQIKQPIISEEKIENKMFENQNQIKQPTVLDEKIENKMFENQNQIKQPIVPDEKIENKMFENQNQIKQPIISEEKIENAVEGLLSTIEELNQSDDNKADLIKDNSTLTDKVDMINKDYNIQDKDILPQMNPNMNFGGDGQPFSSFMNNNTEANQNTTQKLNSTAQDLAEEAAILSTMSENIAIANKNNLLQKPEINKQSTVNKIVPEALNTKIENIDKAKEITVTNQDGIKKVDAKTKITTEVIVKYDNIIMNQADVEVFTELVQKGEVNLNNITTETATKSVQVSKTLADMLAKSMENNQPLRIDFDNNISVIIKISRDGKITADFLPSSQIAEAYLKENLPLLRQRFEDNNINYDSLNQRERKEQQKDRQQKERSQR